MKISCCILVITCLIASGFQTMSQGIINEKDFYEKALLNTTRFYRDSVKDRSLLYNGKEYARYGNGVKGHPFFENENIHQGYISYQGILYRYTSLQYDLYLDAVVIPDYSNSYFIQLLTEKTDSFQLNNHHFVRLSLTNNAVIRKGFYEVLYSMNDIAVLAKRSKRIVSPARPEEPLKFVQTDMFYLRKNNQYFYITDKRSLEAVFADKKTEIKNYLKSSNLNFSKEKETVIISVADFYCKLVSNQNN